MPSPSGTVVFEQRSYSGGVNAASLPSAVMKANELSLIVNGTVRNGYLRTRPAWQWQPLAFLSAEAQLIFENGRYQGSEFFMSNYGNFFTYAIDGHLFSVNPTTRVVSKINEKQAFSKFSPHVWMKQRNKWMVAQDGVSPPATSDGVTFTQEVVKQGIPIGTLMAEGWHRLAVVSPDRRRIYFSDHELDPSSTPISFTEQTAYFANARYFEAPPSLGRIMGMAFTPYQDTSTGIGPLVVFCEKGTRAYNIAVPRSQWATNDISQTILPRVGASSFFAYADKGSQLVFRDQGGRIRTIRNAQQVEATDANFPNDFPVWPLIESEDTALRRYSQAVTFDGRVLILTHPVRDYLPDGRFNVAHKGIAVIENEVISDNPDVWTFWTGHHICGMDVGPVNGTETLMAFCRDEDGKNRLYSLTTDGDYDTVPGEGGAVPKAIRMTFAPPITDYNTPVASKRFRAGGVRLNEMRGTVEVTGRWERDGRQPVPWFNHKETHAACASFDKCKLTFMASGSNPRLVFPALPNGEDTFYKARPIFDIVGPAQVEELVMTADVIPATGNSNTSCKTIRQPAQALCGLDIFAYNAMLAPVADQPTYTPCP
jgi:hypothetical protein